MRQTWSNLLFLHWRFPADQVQRTLPTGLTVDTFEGDAWLGVVPFYMQRVRPAGFPAVTGLSNFLELNVRTYVHDAAGRPGVWFYSLDCNQGMAVRIARTFFHLPYQHAAMDASITAGSVHYQSRRHRSEMDARFVYVAERSGVMALPDSLEFFLLERYFLFAHAPRRGRLYCGQVFHSPYRWSATLASVWSDLPLQQAGFNPAGRPPDHQCTAAPVDVEVFGLQPVKAVSR